MELSKQPSANQSLRAIYIAALLLLTLCHRLFASQVEWLGNTSPLMAIAFGGGMLLGRRFWWVPALLLVVSDIVLALAHGWGLGYHLLMTLPFYVAISLLGAGMQRQNWGTLLGGTLAASLLFYLVANTFAWMTSPAYAHTFAGWWQSQTSGLPGFPPSWTFLRNALLADTLWCLGAAPVFFSKTLSLPGKRQLADSNESLLFS
jgi:hypothetical protein